MATISEIFDAERKKKRDSSKALENLTREEKIRIVNPGLQELWEQYQTMLALVDDGTATDDADDEAIEREMLQRETAKLHSTLSLGFIFDE